MKNLLVKDHSPPPLPLLYDDPRFVLEPRYYFDCDDGWLAGQPQGPSPPLPTTLAPTIRRLPICARTSLLFRLRCWISNYYLYQANACDFNKNLFQCCFA